MRCGIAIETREEPRRIIAALCERGPCSVRELRCSLRSHKSKGHFPGPAEKTAVIPKPHGARRISAARTLDVEAKARGLPLLIASHVPKRSTCRARCPFSRELARFEVLFVFRKKAAARLARADLLALAASSSC